MIVTSMQLIISSRRDIAVLQKESSALKGEEDVKNSVLKGHHEIPPHMVCRRRHDRRTLVRMAAARNSRHGLRSRRCCGWTIARDDQLLAAHQDDHSAIGVLH